MTSFRNRLLINVDHGNEELEFYSFSGTLLARGYTRVVIGKRGPYVEFYKQHIQWDAFYIPVEMQYRLVYGIVFYEEYRSKDPSYVKLYLQKRTVAYADYHVGYCYISPFDLLRPLEQPVII